jgi:fructokinase
MSFNIIGIGEVLWDMLPSGPQLGGAPANFAYHARALGANAQIITRVGRDAHGHEIIRRITAMGLPATGVQFDESAPTGTVSVSLAHGIPEYNIRLNAAWDFIEPDVSALKTAGEADAICFGSLAQRNAVSREAIQRLVAAAPSHCLRIFDINLRQHFYSREIIERSLLLADVLKMNDNELPVLSTMFGLPEKTEAQIESLAQKFDVATIVLTRGGNGSLIYHREIWSKQKSPSVKIMDTVGAGDAFTAAVVMGLLSGEPLDAVHAFAAELAGYVCTCAGATPPLPDNMQNNFTKRISTRQPAIHTQMPI